MSLDVSNGDADGICSGRSSTRSAAICMKLHAALTRRDDGAFAASMRVPQSTGSGADTPYSRFHTGGGRKGAAGINRLPENQLPRFMRAFDGVFSAA